LPLGCCQRRVPGLAKAVMHGRAGVSTQQKLDMSLDDLTQSRRRSRGYDSSDDDRSDREGDGGRRRYDSPGRDRRSAPYSRAGVGSSFGKGRGRRRLPLEEKAFLNTQCFENYDGHVIVRLYDTDVVVLKRAGTEAEKNTEAKNEDRAEAKPEVTSEGKPETQPEAKTEATADTIIEAKLDEKAEDKSPANADSKVEAPLKEDENSATQTPALDEHVSHGPATETKLNSEAPSKEGENSTTQTAAPQPSEQQSSEQQPPPVQPVTQPATVPMADSADAAAGQQLVTSPPPENAVPTESSKPVETPLETEAEVPPAAPLPEPATEPVAVDQKPEAHEGLVVILSSGKFRTAETRFIMNEVLEPMDFKVTESAEGPTRWTLRGDGPARSFEDGMRVEVPPQGPAQERLDSTRRQISDKVIEARTRDAHRRAGPQVPPPEPWGPHGPHGFGPPPHPHPPGSGFGPPPEWHGHLGGPPPPAPGWPGPPHGWRPWPGPPPPWAGVRPGPYHSAPPYGGVGPPPQAGGGGLGRRPGPPAHPTGPLPDHLFQ